MATAAITTSIFQEIQNFNQSRRTDLQQLGSALQSGNLDAAKQAFNDLTSIGQNGPYRNAEPFSNSTRAQAFEAIGKALQSGDLAGAQAAFAALQSTLAKNQSAAGSQSAAQQSGSPAVVVNIGQNSGTTGVSDTESIYQQLQDYRNARKSDLAQLGTALQSGDATAAQTAFNALEALGKTGPNSNGAAFQRSDRADAFNAIGTALQAGDLAGAQQAFANLAASFGEHFVPKEPPTLVPPTTPNPVPEIIINLGGASNNNTAPEVVINIGTDNTTPVSATPPATTGILTTPATTTASTTPELVINIGSGNNSTSNTPGEIQINFGNNSGSLAIDLTPLQGNQSGEQVKIDFTQGSNQNELIVNLFNSGAPSTTSNNQLSLQA